jgi:hypothetical protein
VRDQVEVVTLDRAEDSRAYAAPEQDALVRRLAATTGIEGGPVEHDAPLGVDPDDNRLPLSKRGVLKIETMSMTMTAYMAVHTRMLSMSPNIVVFLTDQQR